VIANLIGSLTQKLMRMECQWVIAEVQATGIAYSEMRTGLGKFVAMKLAAKGCRIEA
jgi:hypothetical protein